jgi:hypothetical protein
MKKFETALWKNLKWPGLAPSAVKIKELVTQVPVRLSVLSYKSSSEFLWVVFIGGTGTGKSTLFNALTGSSLSKTGVERPKTNGPVAYSHKSTPIEKDFPFGSVEIHRRRIDETPSSEYSGVSGQLLVLDHDLEEFSHLVIVDTPDLDSLELKNRQMVEDLQLLADFVIFVASEEKYADDVPFRFLSGIHLGEKAYFLLLNKAEDELTPDEVLNTLRGRGLEVSADRFWVLPYVSSRPSVSLTTDQHFKHFRQVLLQLLSKDRVSTLIQQEKKRAAAEIKSEIQLFLDFLTKEDRIASKWTEQLDMLFTGACQGLFAKHQERFALESRAHIQREIKKHFSKYDLLGKPRRFISQVIRLPFQALGIWPDENAQSPGHELNEICRKADLRMITAAVEDFNRSVLEKLSPHDETSALYKQLRNPDVVLTGEGITRQVEEEHAHLMLRLEQTFQSLANGIPRSKELGIYSTSILWGGLVIALEAAIGGGISLLEAVLDTAVAPFVTKGAVDLFAYHEIKKVVRDLGEHYKEAITATLRIQRERYLECLQSLMVSPQTLQELVVVMRSVEAYAK